MASTVDSYAQGHAPSVLRSQTWRNAENSAGYLLGDLRPGRNVLDVGCGTGTITIDFARRVAPGRVIGVDTEPDVISKAQDSAARLGVDNIEFVVGDAYDLCAAATAVGQHVDVVHAHQLLLHLADPVAALREMLRVAGGSSSDTGGAGLVAARDTDYAGMIWWPPDPRLDRWLALYRAIAHDHGCEPDAGRQLLAWANAAGATRVTPSASNWLHATPERRQAWGGMWAERIVGSAIAHDAFASGRATRADLQDMAEAWREWTASADGWFLVPHGEIRAWATQRSLAP
jgi:SAM-dependent methyltransferase